MMKLHPTLLRRMRTFRDEEDGTVLILSLFLLVLMLLLSGMSVDFMRFEAKRSVMQGCVDNAVLAAADLDKDGTEAELEDITIDWFQAGDCIGVLDSRPKVVPGTKFRSVTASAKLELDTFFLHLMGLDQMTAGSVSAANEGLGDIEVSLVIDISGSMDETIKDKDDKIVDFDPDTDGVQGRTRIEALRLASTSFVEALLIEDYEDKISVSLVPYSGHVNIGETLYKSIKTNTRHGFSHCIDFPNTELDETDFDDSLTYEQVEHFQWNNINGYRSDGSYGPIISEPLCPRYDFEAIIPVSQNLKTLTDNIKLLQPRSATAIYMGLKWGIALLDPEINDTLLKLPDSMIDAAFRDRPVEFATKSGSVNTLKYLVLMTDGENDPHPRLIPEMVDDPSEIATWEDHHWISFRNASLCSNGWSCYNYEEDDAVYWQSDDVDALNDLMQSLCTEARDAGIILFGIAMAATETGQKQISDCVASPSRYFETEGGALVEIFEAIAGQITELRLTQ